MDAGQGDCTLIVYPDNTLTLVDCGSTKGASGADGAFTGIKAVLELYLRENNWTLNNLVLTHPDEDHYNQLYKLKISQIKWMHVYYGGAIDLYQNDKDNNATYGFLKELDGHLAFTPTVTCEPDPELSRAGVNVTVLAVNCTGKPESTSGPVKNSNSVVLLVEYQGAKIFLMGDAFIRTERWIIDTWKTAEKLDRLQSNGNTHVVLKMGHHGSDTSTDPEWLKLIKPNTLVISSGTKRFRGKGMPTKKHLLTDTVPACSLETMEFKQSYVVFNQDNKGQAGKDFEVMDPTQQQIWTTCYGLKWENSRWLEAGQTWYYGVGQDKKKNFDHWIAYTGYEEAQDVDDDNT
jgi:beta-lactamase superfamily II metal-dependent hydrolase